MLGSTFISELFKTLQEDWSGPLESYLNSSV